MEFLNRLNISTGISFEKRKGFFEMLDEIINYKVEKVIITYRGRLSRIGFDLFKNLFRIYYLHIIANS